MMLSRIADALFWIARYMERAEDTARILDVNYHMLLEGSQGPYRLRWEPLVIITGEQERFYSCYDTASPESVFEFLGFRDDNPNSIVNCVSMARENARTIRDRLSRETWEDLNSLYLEVSQVRLADVIADGPHQFCNLVKVGAHRFQGVTAATLPRDEGWHFLQAGEALERAEMTARIVDVQYHTLVEGLPPGGQPDDHQWMAVLKSVAAYEFYRRQSHTRIDPERVAELLVLHPQHPRAVRFNVSRLQLALRAISGADPDGYANEAERLTGRLHESLKYDRIGDVFRRGLHQYLVDVQSTCTEIGGELARSYFYYAAEA
jgi:uncharacterized alpha-E superfamily protein